MKNTVQGRLLLAASIMVMSVNAVAITADEVLEAMRIAEVQLTTTPLRIKYRHDIAPAPEIAMVEEEKQDGSTLVKGKKTFRNLKDSDEIQSGTAELVHASSDWWFSQSDHIEAMWDGETYTISVFSDEENTYGSYTVDSTPNAVQPLKKIYLSESMGQVSMLGEETTSMGVCIILRNEDPGNGCYPEQIIKIFPERSFLPLERIFVGTNGAKVEIREEELLELTPGLWLPQTITMQTIDSTGEVVRIERFTFLEATVMTSFSPSDYHVAVRPPCWFTDQVNGLSYVIHDDK